MKKNVVFTVPAGPYSPPHTFRIQTKEYAKNKIVFAELVEGEWSIEETSYTIYSYLEEKHGIKADSFILITKLLWDEKVMFEITKNEKSQLELKDTPEYFSKSEFMGTEELKAFLNEQKANNLAFK